MNIVHLYAAYEQKVSIGKIRKDLVDAVLLRKQKAGLKHELIIASHDADLKGINNGYIDNLLDDFKNSNVDAVVGKIDYPKSAYEKFPLFHVSQRLLQYFTIAFRRNFLHSPEMVGANSALRAGTYAAIGGYNERSVLGEDLELGWMIKEARGYEASRIRYDNRLGIKTDPRRPVIKMLSGGKLIEQYGDFHQNEEVRRQKVSELLESAPKLDLLVLEKELESIYHHYHSKIVSNGGWIPDIYFVKSFDRAMRFLGAKYEVRDGKFVMTDVTRLRKALDKYKTPSAARINPSAAA
ncbi:hypothetical protein A3C17_01470 [Candidatus Uhrbacteria bacterium RIFCSPHIGHO2_02_FULL_53_13]|uniref:Glycosyltransferase 2-like domain-containing protein n=1 Tax=Candidatus Uhrbacteria bacterium RIFCSPHIGHO2_02_FULL_53_13 TaxID=1802389 RepID=A0A1F7TYS1_9BACT|nr:MAG: hypothetical protein A3C17_01470 [Candidatus Uhrbacteria bacterium RIFCSPHIGHO2_02_FULL_53_13]